MNILFVHQNFPGQFVHVAPYFASLGHRVVAVGQGDIRGLPGVETRSYQLARGNTPGMHPFAQEFESKTLRGEACRDTVLQLKNEGFTPDVIFAHPGWGETLFLKDVFPKAKLICLMEYYYRAEGQDMGFDPEFGMPTLEDRAMLAAKNANLLLAMEAMDAGIAPTPWQKSLLPEWAQAKTHVIHEGIDTDLCKPDPTAEITLPDRGVTVRAGDEVLTFVARNLEPVRGYHIFMRALPQIMRERPNVKVFIVGGDGVSYGRKPESGSYRDQFLREVAHELDPNRVFFLGKVPHHVFIRLMQITRCHVYLTYPFVLSWSLLEAMACGATVVASDTAPVRDVIVDGDNGVLTDFFNHKALVHKVTAVLQSENKAGGRLHARENILANYSVLNNTLPQYEALAKTLTV